jgi:hypothetical protein
MKIGFLDPGDFLINFTATYKISQSDVNYRGYGDTRNNTFYSLIHADLRGYFPAAECLGPDPISSLSF